MEKKSYVKPKLNYEEFVPQEYVAACYAIACTVTTEDKVNNKTMDHSGSCKSETNQYIVDNADGSFSMWENSSDQGHLDCYFVSSMNDTSYGSSSISSLTNGQTVYWKTYASNNDGRVWTHKGTFVKNVTNTTNHS